MSVLDRGLYAGEGKQKVEEKIVSSGFLPEEP
jgi:hypothetical protein